MLSQRYQINENIRLIQYIAPFIFTATFSICASGLILFFLIPFIPDFSQYPASSILFSLLYKCGILLIYIHETWLVLRMTKKMKILFKKPKIHKIKPINSKQERILLRFRHHNITVKNAEHEAHIHFEQLKKAWN
uniref:Photosystem I assembly protein Ycf4 n=1 Tax=Panagrolaimus sp. JU765 TaxID=591449 RepID=A0AC34R002_9BILA